MCTIHVGFFPVRYIFTVTPCFHPFRIRRRLMFELICESAKIYAFQKSVIIPLDCLSMFYFCFKYKFSNSCIPLPCLPWKNMCFQNNMCTETTLREFSISLVLDISCESVNVVTESRSFSAFEKCRVFTDGNKTIISLPIFLPTCIGTFMF